MRNGLDNFIFAGGITLVIMATIPGTPLLGSVVSAWVLFGVSVLVASILWALCLWEPNALVKTQTRYQSISDVISDTMFVLSWTGWVMLALGWSNVLLDTNDTKTVELPVVSEDVVRWRRSKFRIIRVEGWPKPDSITTVGLYEDDEPDPHVGDRVRLEVGDGLLGLKYVVGYTRVD